MVAHDTMQPQALVLVVLFPVLSTIFVVLRVWIRITMQQFHWGAYITSPRSYLVKPNVLTFTIPTDDGLCVVCCVLAVAYAGVVYHWIQVNWFGYHIFLKKVTEYEYARYV
jgi:hypothetical protein